MAKLEIKNGRMDITDPGYDRGIWCAFWDIPVKNGCYDVSVRKVGRRISSIKAILTDETPKTEKVLGVAGVDSGLCGFFAGKPTFNREEWLSICKDIRMDEESGKDIFVIPTGVFASSRYGDGGYPVSAYYNEDGVIIGVEITFIEEEVE